MPALARGQASNCANPTLDLYTQVNGVATDVYSLAYQIFDVSDAGKQLVPLQVYPTTPGERAACAIAIVCPLVGGGKLSTGHFVATYTPELTEALGTHQIRWYFKLTSVSPEQSFREEFEVLPEVAGVPSTGYCPIQDLRDAGISSVRCSDARAQAIISLASRYIDRMTGRWFEPRSATIKLDGTGTDMLLLEQPIIAIQQIKVGYSHNLTAEIAMDLDDLVVYNRHLTQGLRFPDDRDNPKLILEGSAWPSIVSSIWPRGNQNVEIIGVFGYTDPDGSPNGQGITPDMIRRVCLLIALRYVPAAGSGDYYDSLNRSRIISERTRDQSYNLQPYGSGSAGGASAWTGDPEIDNCIAAYCRPLRMGAV